MGQGWGSIHVSRTSCNGFGRCMFVSVCGQASVYMHAYLLYVYNCVHIL